MKTSFLSWTVALLAASALVACGDDGAGTGGGGTGGDGTGGTSSATTSASSTTTGQGPATTTGSQGTGGDGTGGDGTGGNGTGGDGTGGDGTGGDGTGGNNGCSDLAFTDVAYDAGAYVGGVDPALGGAGTDYSILVFGSADQVIDFTDSDPVNDSQFVFAGEDFDDKAGYAAIYFANEGTLTVADGQWSLEGVVLREINLDDGSFVDGGACYNVADLSGRVDGPPAEWLCDPAYYDAADGCDCLCGAYDPDCDIPDATVFGCEEGQTCDPDTAECAGVPTAWECGDETYGDGATCDCACGTADPDCDPNLGLPIDGCGLGQTCSAAGECLDPESLCTDLTDNDNDLRFDCDDDTACGLSLDCVPGLTAVGEACDANTDCAGTGPLCQSEEDFGYPGGMCSTWCSVEDQDCAAGSTCRPLIFGFDRGACFADCEETADCDNEEAVCGGGVCVAGGVEGWSCPAAYYGTDDGCDCGCGIADPDCAGDTSPDACEFCDFQGSCANNGETGLGCDLDALADDDNAVCE